MFRGELIQKDVADAVHVRDTTRNKKLLVAMPLFLVASSY